ncbi:Ig domain-containing protein [bacterium]|nr:Ig domain-containing protein [bacterium]MBU1433989.1 Ig domain-containing protein [bacterium]MBU1502971.1 Ig domain-containing protein [bacterium]
MKTRIRSFIFTPFVLFCLFFFSSALYAVELVNEQFTSNINGWSVSSSSKVYYSSTNNGSLFIDRNDRAWKTYNFGSTYADQTLTVQLRWCDTDSWETTNDFLRVNVNDTTAKSDYNGMGCKTATFTANANGIGDFKIEFSPRTSQDSEDAYIDWLTINGTPIAETPPTIASIPSQIATVNSSFSLNLSSFVGLTNNDPIILPYVLIGTLPAGLTFNDATGVISGTPTIITTASNFVFKASDNDGQTSSNTFTLAVAAAVTDSNGGRNFIQRSQSSLFGDVKVIGNTTLCILNNSGVCVEPTTTNSNADTNLQKAPQSYSTLTLPLDATVEYARLYWQGRKAATSNNDAWDSTSKTAAGTIKIRKGSAGGFTTLTADIKDFDSTQSSNYVRTYSASADASSVVTGSDTYYIDTASFYTNTGTTNNNNPSDGLGAYGAWVLVVVYQDPHEAKARNITLFDGYKQVTKDTGDIDISVSGFLTPRTGVVDSKTYVFTAEGDKWLTNNGDVIKMAGLTYNTSLVTLGTFDSRVDVAGTRNPNLLNNNGIDIHKYDTGTTTGARNIIGTNEVGAKFKFTSDQDTYFPSLIVFSTELYLPQLCYDYSLKQDGQYLAIDRNTYPIAHLDSVISSSDVEVTVYLKNREADIAAEGIAIKADINDSAFDQIGHIYTSNVNGSSLIDRGTPSFSGTLCDYDPNGNNSVTNSGCTTGHDIRKGNGSLDAQDYIYTKYILKPKHSGLASVNQALGLSIRYYITANGNKVVYPDYILGGTNVPLCPPTGAYQPKWGYFNVVQSGQANASIKNNIYTQISRKPFDASVVFDSTPSTGNNQAPASDINTTLLVEIIDLDAFGDINASCANPDSSRTQPVFVPINFSPSIFQTNITAQTNDYYNFAVKNAAFRLWYFNDVNDVLIQHWTASTSDSGKTLNSIAGLYLSSAHPLCSSSCSSPTSTTCFNCIKTNYAKPLCSRDNFSIRPESYDLRIFDVDKLLPAYDIKTDSSNIKNTSKIDLSSLYGYDPLNSNTPSNRIDLAGGYTYRFDITATGHDGISYVPGYTRDFNNEIAYKAMMNWDPQSIKTGCNDTTNKSIAFYIANGKMLNEEREHLEVGEYRLNVFDTSWTAVDWQNMIHHTVANAFTTDYDCNINSTLSSLINNRHGCNISTNHGGDGGGRVYRDHDFTFHPYKFNVTDINASVGLSLVPVSPDSYIYMADMNQSEDENMSLHLNGKITAQGFDEVLAPTFKNFVSNCYAKPLDINISESDTSHVDSNGNNVLYKLRFHDLNATGSIINALDINVTKTLPTIDARIQTTQGYFLKDLNGSMDTILNLNYHREVNASANPKSVTVNHYEVNCTNAVTDCTFNADLVNNKTAQGFKTINATVQHYYGRTNVPKQVYMSPVGTSANPANDLIFYEVFCNGAGCDKTLLQNGVNSQNSDDPRWFINTNHINGFGTAGTIWQKNATNVTATNPTGVHQDSTNLVYDGGKGYPYKATMENNASSWLIYNRYDINDINNSFDVEFQSGESGWTGIHYNNTNTALGKGAIWTNKRLDW